MPASTPGTGQSGTRKAKPKPVPKTTATPVVPRNADTGDKARAKPAPPLTIRPAFKPPATTRPFAGQQAQAQQKVRLSKRGLPAPTLAAPPIIGGASKPKAKGAAKGEPAMSRAQVEAFLKSQSEVTQHARKQIVDSIRKQVGNVHGQERQDRIAGLMDEIATDPRLAPTRRAIRHYTNLEKQSSRPQTTAELKAGPEHHKAGVGFATIDLTAAGTAAEQLAEKAAPGLMQHDATGQFVRNAVKDVGSLGYGPFVAGWATSQANIHDALKVLGGENIGKVATQGETAQIAKGIAKGIAHEVAHPVDSFREHPVLTVLDAAGAVSVLGRGAGAAARAGGKKGAPGVRGKLDAMSHTVRPPLGLLDDAGQPILVQRTYSKDLTRRGAQAQHDRHREPVRDAKGNPVYVEDRGRKVPVLKATEAERSRHFNRRGDFTASRANLGERAAREQAAKDSRVKGVRGKAAREIVSMVVEGTITSAKNFRADLEAHRQKLVDRIQRHEDGTEPLRHSGSLQAAQNRLRLVEKVLGNPKAMAQAERIVQEAERHGRRLNEGDAASADAKIGNAEQMRRAALSVTALEHMGGRHFTVEEHAGLERDARQAEAAAAQRFEQAKTPADRAAAQADMAAARQHRIAVSGRDPVKVEAHESAQSAYGKAKVRQKRAHEAERKAEERVRALASTHKSERGKEAHHGPVATYYVGQHRFALRGDAIAFAKSHGIHPREIRRVALTSGEAKRVGQLSQARRALAAAKAERRAADKDVKAADRAARENPLPPANAALRYGEKNPFGKPAGAHLPNEDIEAFLHSKGRDPKTVAYLTHRQDTRGARAHHAQARPGTRPNLDGGDTRTGQAYLDGITESSQALLRDAGVRQAVQLNKAKALDQFIADNGLRHPAWAKALRGETLTKGEQRIVDKGGLFTAKEAADLAKQIANDHGQRLTPVRAYQDNLDPRTKEIIREDYQGPGGMETLSGRLLDDRIVRPTDKIDPRARNVTLVPAELVERMEAHLRPAGAVERFFQYLNKPFRMAVLPQPRWMTGQFVEPYLVRLPTVGSGINVFGLAADWVAANRGLKALENGTPEMRRAAQQIRDQQVGSGLFLGGKGGGVHRTAQEVMPEFAQRAYGRMVAKLPVTGHTMELARSAAHWIAMPLHAFFWISNKFIDSPAQRAAFGHTFRRDMQAITGSWIKSVISMRAAVLDAAKGYTNTAAQHRAMQDQYNLLGKYSGMNPTLRAFTQSVAPFIPWMLNAAKFVYWTMPANNTIKTALLMKVNEVVQKDWDEIHSATPPGGLRDAIPTQDGGWLDLARYTPFGLTAPIARGGDLRSVTSQFTPQLGGSVNALQGKDPFGRPLKLHPTDDNPTGKPNVGDMLWIAGYDLLEATVSYMSTGRRLQEHGETGYADSTIFGPKTKPGTSHGRSAISRTFNPLNPTYLNTGGPTVPAAPKKPDRFKKARDQSVEDDLLDNLDQSLNGAQGQQDVEDDLLNNLYDDG